MQEEGRKGFVTHSDLHPLRSKLEETECQPKRLKVNPPHSAASTAPAHIQLVCTGSTQGETRRLTAKAHGLKLHIAWIQNEVRGAEFSEWLRMQHLVNTSFHTI